MCYDLAYRDVSSVLSLSIMKTIFQAINHVGNMVACDRHNDSCNDSNK